MVKTTRQRPDVQLIAPYQPLPWAIPAWRDKHSVVLYAGSAGGGKSLLAANRLHGFCLKYPNSTAMVLRKERSSHTNSTLPMLERAVIGNDPNVKPAPSKHRYEYANGSLLIYGGMADEQQRENVRSMSIDIAWMEEATQFSEADYNELLGRMRGNAANWRQIILTTNPDAPTHWIKRRLIDGLEAHIYLSSARDNPYLPEEYHASLASMTGITRQRLLEGKWTQAEGVIYDNWALENISADADYNPAYGPIYWGVDDGYVYGGGPGTLSYHPRVILMAQVTPMGGLNVFAEYYKTLELPEASISNALALDYPMPDLAFVDSSAAELRSRFSSIGIMNTGATHPVGEGIKNLRRFICDGNGQRLIHVHPRCRNLIGELQTYRYADSTTGVVAGEPKPEKLDDHGCFVAGTMVTTARGNVAIQDIRRGDRVLTREGYFPVIDAGLTSISAEVFEVTFSDGRTLRGTSNHPVWVEGTGYTDLDALRYGDIIRTDFRCSEVLPWQKRTPLFARKKSRSTGSYSGAIQTQNGLPIGATSNHMLRIFGAAWRRFTVKSGKRTTGRSLTGGTFTTRTGIPETTGSKTSNAYPALGTYPSMRVNPIAWNSPVAIWTTCVRWLRHGIEAKRGGRGIVNTDAERGTVASPSSMFAINAAQSSSRLSLATARGSVRTSASQHGDVYPAWITKIEHAPNAEQRSQSTDTTKRNAAQDRAPQSTVTVVDVRRLSNRAPVYNLTVDAVPEYYANGVLVHNCDAARYLAWGLRYIGASE